MRNANQHVQYACRRMVHGVPFLLTPVAVRGRETMWTIIAGGGRVHHLSTRIEAEIVFDELTNPRHPS